MRYSLESRCKMVALMVEGVAPQVAAAACGASRATGYRLWRRYRQGGWAALGDRRSTPHRQPRRLDPEAERETLALRRRTNAGPLVIAAISGRPASTVGKVLRRWGCSRLPRPERDPVIRYERARPGELVHVDTKQLGRFHVVGKRILRDGVNRSRRAGWQHLHIAIDDHTRLAYAEVLPGQDKHACAAFWERAIGWYATQGIRVERVYSDNAKALGVLVVGRRQFVAQRCETPQNIRNLAAGRSPEEGAWVLRPRSGGARSRGAPLGISLTGPVRGLKLAWVGADESSMSSAFTAIRVAVTLAVVGAGYVGYQHVLGSSASAHDRAVSYLTQYADTAAKLGRERFRADSISCDSTASRPTAAEASRLGSGASLFDCTVTTTTGQLGVMCVGVGGEIPNGVVLLSSNSHCADVSKVFAANAAS
jgi:transposase